MKFDIVEYDATNPQQVEALLDKLVAACWILPGSLFVAFRDGTALDARAVPVVGYEAALSLRIGRTKPGTDWLAALKDYPRPDEFDGLPFRGLDGNILVFGDHFGVRLLPDGVDIVVSAA